MRRARARTFTPLGRRVFAVAIVVAAVAIARFWSALT
jgi:hypothetical protein